MLTATFVGASMSLGYPLFSLILEETHHEPWVIGLIAAAQGAGVLMVAPIAPKTIERFGARKTMQLGILLCTTAILLKGIAVEAVFWLVLRLILGVGAGLIFIVSEAAVNALANDRNRGRILGVYGTLFCVGYAAGPIVIAVAGTSGWMPFLLSAGLLFSGILPAHFAKAADQALAGHQPGVFSAKMLSILKIGTLPLFAIFMFGFIEASLLNFLPIYGLDHGLGQSEAALMLSVWIAGNIVLQYPIGMISDRFPRFIVLSISAAIAAISLCAIPFIMDQAWVRWTSLAIQGSAMGGVYVLSLAILGERFRGSVLALANTAFVVALEIGLIFGPSASGVAISLADTGILPLLMAALLIILSLAALGGRRGHTTSRSS